MCVSYTHMCTHTHTCDKHTALFEKDMRASVESAHCPSLTLPFSHPPFLSPSLSPSPSLSLSLPLASALPCSLFPPRLYMYIDRTACSLAGYIHIQHAVPVWKICIAHATQGVWHELGHEQVRSRPTQFSWRTRSCRPSTMNPFIPAHVHPGFTFLFS